MNFSYPPWFLSTFILKIFLQIRSQTFSLYKLKINTTLYPVNIFQNFIALKRKIFSGVFFRFLI